MQWLFTIDQAGAAKSGYRILRSYQVLRGKIQNVLFWLQVFFAQDNFLFVGNFQALSSTKV